VLSSTAIQTESPDKKVTYLFHLILTRFGVSVLTLWFVSVLVFVGTEMLPGDVAQAVLGQSATPETLAGLRAQLGLDRPPHIRYFEWLAGFVTGDLGTSLANDADIATLISQRLGNTLLLAGTTAALAVPLAVGLGLLAATVPGSILDRTITAASLFFVSIPEFLLATIFVLFFAVKLRWFSAISYVTEFNSVSHFFSTMTLPIVVLSAALTAQMARMVRATVLNVLSMPYIEMALLKGVKRNKIIFLHGVVNVIGPIANVIALNLAYLVSGVVIVETIFAYPGLAKMIVDAVATRDFPVVQSCALIFCATYIVLMLVADIVAILSNPRMRRS
jgi:peptide/nickel transport system permease protein